MELLGVGTVKSIRFSKFGFGFGRFCGVLEQLADNFCKFLSFGRSGNSLVVPWSNVLICMGSGVGSCVDAIGEGVGLELSIYPAC